MQAPSDTTWSKRGSRPQPIPNVRMTGTLTVEVIEASDLIAADKEGTSDPYASIQIGQVVQKTKTIKKSLNPAWNQKFTFQIVKQSFMKLKVFDHDRFSKDDKIAKVTLPLEIFLPSQFSGQPIEDWFGLSKQGEIHLKVSFHSAKSIKKPSNFDELLRWTDPNSMQPGYGQGMAYGQT